MTDIGRRAFLEGLATAGIAAVWLARMAQSEPMPPFGLTDSIDVSRDGSEKAHGFLTTGNAARAVAGDIVGGHDTRRTARAITGKGGAVSYQVNVHPGQPVTLEFEELYNRDTDVIAYSVFADGRKLAFRTFRGCGAGPVHYFVQMPPTQKAAVTLRIVSECDAPFHLSRIWAWSDFDRAFDAGKFDVPYRLAPYVALSFTDESADRAKVRQIKTSLGNHPNALPAFSTPVAYASGGRVEAERRIDYVLRVAETENLPVQLHLDTWWGSTPSGSDGKGGYWNDVRYQQVVWNDSARRYQLSIPNRWANTPWLSPNQPDLIAFKERRLRLAAAHLARRLRERREAGKPDILLAVNIDNEPVYWASGNAGLGSDLLQADFNAATVARAAKNGVTLAPDKQPLGFRERKWLLDDLLRYNERMGAAARAALAKDKASDDIYTQAMVGDAEIQYPMLDAAYPFWEAGAPASINAGGEWNGDSTSEREAVQHMIALGRNAAVNAEAGNNVEKMKGVRPGYALGQRYFTLYNYPLDRMEAAAAEIRDVTQPFPPFVYMPTLLEHGFQSESWRKIVARAESVQTGIIGNTAATAVFASYSDTPGILLYRIVAPNKGTFTTGLQLELTWRAFVFRKTDPSVCIRVLAGEDIGSDTVHMSEVARFHDTGNIGPQDRIDLTAVSKGRKAVWVRIEIHAPGLPANVLSWCSIRHVRFTTAWSEAATEGGFAQDVSLRNVRKQSLLVSWRADAENALRYLEARSPKNDVIPHVRALYEAGNYTAAYFAAAGAVRADRAKEAIVVVPEPVSARRFTGVFRGAQSGKLILLPDDPDADHDVTFAASFRITLSINGQTKTANSSDLLYGDRVEAAMDAQGNVESIQASRGLGEGLLMEAGQVTPYAMPYVRLVGEGESRRTVDLSAIIHLPDKGSPVVRSIPLGNLPLAAGDRIRIRFDPVSGRVYEIWKT